MGVCHRTKEGETTAKGGTKEATEGGADGTTEGGAGDKTALEAKDTALSGTEEANDCSEKEATPDGGVGDTG